MESKRVVKLRTGPQDGPGGRITGKRNRGRGSGKWTRERKDSARSYDSRVTMAPHTPMPYISDLHEGKVEKHQVA